MSEIKYEIIKQIGVLSKSTSGWAKELNLISWNERDAKYPLRPVGHLPHFRPPSGMLCENGGGRAGVEKMGKGVTLSKEELSTLKELLNSIEL